MPDVSLIRGAGGTFDGPTLAESEGHEHPPRMWLTLMDGERSTLLPLPPEGDVRIGRGADCDLQLCTPLASRVHARLSLGQRVTIEDLGSVNGTLVGTRRLSAHTTTEIEPGGAIIIGGATLVLHRGRPGGKSLPPTSRQAPHADTADAPVVAAPSTRALHALVARIAVSELPALILGETGSGKELVAATVHQLSRRSGRPYVQLNCATLSETLLESELFGHERGSFTGATASKTGLLESANGGTVFLDEVGEMSLTIQAKLLRVLDIKEVTRVGSVRARPIDVRFVAATNRDLRGHVRSGVFREDLYFRLNGITLHVPPLRQRVEEIEPLARRFLRDACARLGMGTPPALTPATLAVLLAHPWPGNVRELRHVMERALLLCDGQALDPAHLRLENDRDEQVIALEPGPVAPALSDVRAHERARIIDALTACAGNQSRAAEQLGMPRRTLVKKLARYKIPRPRSVQDVDGHEGN